jgi:hypothetical protein
MNTLDACELIEFFHGGFLAQGLAPLISSKIPDGQERVLLERRSTLKQH